MESMIDECPQATPMRVKRRRSGGSPRMLMGFAIWAAVVGTAGVGLVVANQQPTQAEAVGATGTSPLPTTASVPAQGEAELRNLDGLPIPEGMEAVLNDDGWIVGYVPAELLAIRAGPPPQLTLAGHLTALRGFEVVNDSNKRVGYFVAELGFASLAESEDPEVLEAEVARLRALAEETYPSDAPPATAPDGGPADNPLRK